MRRIVTVTLFLLCIVAVAPLAAQNQQGNDDSMLPEIDPQDIEIRSQFKARFPGLRRQPILGFEPASRIYKVDPNRMPYLETQEDAVADLSVSDLSRPEPPQFAPLQYSEEINAFARAGLGSYTSPEAQFWGISRLSDKSYIGGDLDYSSSNGHLDGQSSSFRFFNANGEFAAKVDEQTRLGFDLGLQNSFNHTINFDPSLGTPRKEYGGFNLGAELERRKNGIEGWKVQANARFYQAELLGSSVSGKTDEAIYNGSFTKQWAGSNIQETFSIKLEGTLGDYNTSIVADQWMTGRAGVVYERLFGYETDLMVDASVYYGSDIFDDKVYFGPAVKVTQPLAEALILTVKAGAKPYVKTAEQLHSTNRFLRIPASQGTSNDFRHTYQMYGAADIEIKITDVGSLKGGIRYEDISDRPIFERGNTSTDAYSFYGVRYADVTKAEIYAGASHQIIPERFWLHGKVYAQSVDEKDGGRVPFTEKYGLNSGFGLRLFQRATLEGWADYIGGRKNDQAEDMKDYVLIGGKLDFEITDNIGVYGKVVNLLDQEYQYWEGYTERPLQVYGGLTLKF